MLPPTAPQIDARQPAATLRLAVEAAAPRTVDVNFQHPARLIHLVVAVREAGLTVVRHLLRACTGLQLRNRLLLLLVRQLEGRNLLQCLLESCVGAGCRRTALLRAALAVRIIDERAFFGSGGYRAALAFCCARASGSVRSRALLRLVQEENARLGPHAWPWVVLACDPIVLLGLRHNHMCTNEDT